MIPAEEAARNHFGLILLGQSIDENQQCWMLRYLCVTVCLTVSPSLRRPALRCSAGSCSVTSGCWREVPALSWLFAPDCGLKPSSRWDNSTLCSTAQVHMWSVRTGNWSQTGWEKQHKVRTSVFLYCPLSGRSSNNSYSTLHANSIHVFTTLYLHIFIVYFSSYNTSKQYSMSTDSSQGQIKTVSQRQHFLLPSSVFVFY